MIPRELSQLRHIELLEIALDLSDQRGSGGPDLGKLSRDRLIAFILDRRESKDRDFRRRALEFMNRDGGRKARLAKR